MSHSRKLQVPAVLALGVLAAGAAPSKGGGY